ncbi:nuclear transport factor 2 family protein [Actinokineospora sp. NBRC 105648]|uniref:nuclear transport factor 2 family protein n=1 Tax=Actinokineospora sp. NBRC 105648 TaxID=3032206 RepID=UPI002553C089|nr:nuclear transport factor 2 family protein [Actinokineospora sp. NBRC 105648]
MTTTESTTEVTAERYAEVQHFYARQMRLLDDRDFPAFAATFTEDGEFSHTPGHAVSTRAGIVAELHEFHRRFDGDPVVRRHWFDMIVLDPAPGGALTASFYAYAITVRPGGDQVVGPSCLVRDVLVREAGQLRNRSRHVTQDRLTF